MGNRLLLLGPHNRPLKQRRPTLRQKQPRLRRFPTCRVSDGTNLDGLDHANRSNDNGIHIRRETTTRKLRTVLVFAPLICGVFHLLVYARYLVYDSGGFPPLLRGEWCVF